MRKFLLAALFTTVGAYGAMADDVFEEAPIVDIPAGFSWTGAYVGVQAGYGWSGVDQPWGDVGGPIEFGQDDADGNGFLGGVHVGYNWQSNSFVFGVEGDIEASNIDGDDGGSGGDVNGFEFDWMGSLRTRVGYSIDRTLIYATGGYAFMRGTAYNDDAPREEDSATFHGWTLGAGVEHAFTDNITARLEYRYADFGSKRISLPISDYDEQIDPNLHSVRIGISYKF